MAQHLRYYVLYQQYRKDREPDYSGLTAEASCRESGERSSQRQGCAHSRRGLTLYRNFSQHSVQVDERTRDSILQASWQTYPL